MKKGVELIAEERQRQINVEGYNEQHDSQHQKNELIQATLAYIHSAMLGIINSESGIYNEKEIIRQKMEYGKMTYPDGWTFKPSTDIRDLVKAGALIAAAIDRLQVMKKDLNRQVNSSFN